MKTFYIKTIFVILLLTVLGFVFGWSDNGPRKVDVDTLPSRLDQ